MDIVLEQARENHVQKVLKVNLVVGKMSGVVPEALKFCFGILTPGTVAEGATLAIEEVAFCGKCKDCGQSFEIIDYRSLCPDCNSRDIETTGGQELYIKQMEVE